MRAHATLVSVLLTAALAPALLAQAPAPGIGAISLSGSILVAAALVIPAGSADDPDSIPGAARLLGEAVAHAARSRLDPTASRLDMRVERGWTAYTLVSMPDVWVRSWSVLDDVVFRGALEESAIEIARTSLIEGFAFDAAAPVHEFRRELYHALGGARDPWSRDPRGTPAALQKVGSASLEDFRRQHYRPAQATAAVVGPVTEQEVGETLAPVGTGPLGGPTSAGPAWERGNRLRLERDVTNAWIGAAFPAPSGLPRTQLEFVAHQLAELLSPSLPDPGVFSVFVRIEDTPKGAVVVVEAAVMPEVSETWEKNILAAVDRLEEETDEPFFRWQQRRFRSTVLLREGQPKEAALRAALDLARDGAIRSLTEELEAIGPHDLAAATSSLEAPRVLVIGPRLGDGGVDPGR